MFMLIWAAPPESCFLMKAFPANIIALTKGCVVIFWRFRKNLNCPVWFFPERIRSLFQSFLNWRCRKFTIIRWKLKPLPERRGAGAKKRGVEKIDIIEWSENPEKFLAAALSPAKVKAVEVSSRREARVYVPEDQLSLAIGKNGQN